MNTIFRIITITGIAFLGLLSCNEQTIDLDYCKMIAEDQSFVNTDKSDMETFNADKASRKKLIEKNFDLLVQKTRQSGFPMIQDESMESCKSRAVTMTMLHGAQTLPELFFSEPYVALFKAEMDKGNLERKILLIASTLTARTVELCDGQQPEIEAALALWELDVSLFAEAKFMHCD